jgi:hypothetical protein
MVGQICRMNSSARKEFSQFTPSHGIRLPVPPVNTAAPCFDLREAMSMSPDPHQAREKDTSGSLESSNCNQDNNLITIILEC